LMVLYFDGKLKKNILYVKTQENWMFTLSFISL